MILPLFALAVVGLIVVTSEILWRLKLLREEAGRKFIHILTAIWVSTWPFFLTFKTITFLSFILLVGIVLAKKLNASKSIHTTERLSSGDVLFPIGIGLTSLLTTNKWIFCTAMLQIGLADGLAGLIGRHFNAGRYKVLGHTKSVLGTAIFYIVSMVITIWLIAYSEAGFHASVLLVSLIILPTANTIAENFSPWGIDNITVPLITVGLLSLLV